MPHAHVKRARVEKPQASRKRQRNNNALLKSNKHPTVGSIVLQDHLQWQDVALPDQLEDAEGFFGLQEIDNVEVVRSEKDGTVQYRVGKIFKLHRSDSKLKTSFKLVMKMLHIVSTME